MSTYRRVEEYLAYAEHEATVRAHQAETSEVRAVHRCSAYCNQDLLTLVNSCKARIWYPLDSTYLSTCIQQLRFAGTYSRNILILPYFDN